SIGKFAVFDNFTAAYNALTSATRVLTPFQQWQVAFFGSITNPAAAPDADPDHDGRPNSAEYLAGTDPTDPPSVLRINGVAQQDNDLLISWTTGVGGTNVLQEGASLDGSGSFADLAVVQTTNSVTKYLDVGAATNGTPRYYRVRLGP